jgi:rSAM/selenodomain-associated transferase 1
VNPPVVLVMAKAPVPGRAKTRLGRHLGDDAAARLASAALADTLVVCAAVFGATRCYLALDGDLHGTATRDTTGDAPGLLDLLAGWTVVPQRGGDFGHRLAHAHHDVAALSRSAVVQLGMDTPQVTTRDLELVAAGLARADAVLGDAEDGGWWVLGLRDPRLARCLTRVAMSTDHTGADTRAALVAAGASVVAAPTLGDVDEPADGARVAALAPHTRFARQWAVESAREVVP